MNYAFGPVRAIRTGEPFLIAAWWMCVVCLGLVITLFSHEFVPAKFGYDAAILRSLLESRDLWSGMSYEGFINTARVWSIVLRVVPEAVAVPGVYCLVALAMIRLLDVFDLDAPGYHLIAGGWLLCAALFLAELSKEMIAVPLALGLCMSSTRTARFVAAALFLFYAAFFRQYWAICYFYFVCGLFALRLHVANRSGLALCILLVAFFVPFVAANALDLDPLTSARTMINADRVDSPDARSAFNNTFDETGVLPDVANAVIAWFYMNIPVALLTDAMPHYVAFAIFQLCSLALFASGCASYLRNAKRIGHPGTIYPRCAAFVCAYSVTLSIFEPDFGSFFRHEIVLMIPMLVLAFHRGRAQRERRRSFRIESAV
jgi:hypothetical protein